MDLGKPQRAPLTVFFGTVRFFPKIKIFPPSVFWCFAAEWMLKNPKGSPLSVFWCFAAEWMLKNPKGSPLSIFRHCEIFSEICFFSEGSPLQLRQKCWQFRKCPLLARQGLALAGPGAPLGPFFWVCNFFENFFFKKFLIFEYCKREYLTLGSLFAIFEPLIWRQLGPVPVF